MSQKVREILSHYHSDNVGVKTNLARFLNQGVLGGTGKMVILPVDQGFEHGPARSFAANPDAYDPHYHFRLAIDAGLSGYAAPLGALQASAEAFAGQIPTILKMNSGNSLYPKGEEPTQAITASVKDALRLGCSAIGFTIYAGSAHSYTMYEEIREIAEEAKAHGLVVIIWSYPRGGELTKPAETALDICAYSAHMAALLGAHIIKVKLPDRNIELAEAKKIYEVHNIARDTMPERIAHIKQACFAGRRLVIFSGGATKDADAVIQDARDIVAGGGDGSILGRNAFQRPYDEALILLKRITDIYLKG
jgi:fructose-bisphosphate aldolase, class I